MARGSLLAANSNTFFFHSTNVYLQTIFQIPINGKFKKMVV